MLVRGVKGAFDMIKTALPNSPLDDENPFPIPRSSMEDVNQIVKFQEHLLDYSSRVSNFSTFPFFSTFRST